MRPIAVLFFAIALYAQGVLPDPTLTPGAINPDITQDNIKQNICNKHWSTKSIRPPTSYTNKLKARQLKERHLTGGARSYEEDHLISLELGGDPRNELNLWPEPYLPKPGAREKDRLESALHADVCNGSLTLAEAQKLISEDWYSEWKRRFGK